MQVTFLVQMNPPNAPASLALWVDWDHNNFFDPHNLTWMTNQGAGVWSATVGVHPPVQATPFVLQISAPGGTALVMAARDSAGNLLYQTGQPVPVPATGQTWLAGHL